MKKGKEVNPFTRGNLQSRRGRTGAWALLPASKHDRGAAAKLFPIVNPSAETWLTTRRTFLLRFSNDVSGRDRGVVTQTRVP